MNNPQDSLGDGLGAAAPSAVTMQNTILLIDHDDHFRTVFKSFLVQAGYAVLDANSAAKGKSLLRDRNVRLVIVDIRVPHLDCGKTISFLRRACPNLLIIATSGGGFQLELTTLARAVGADYAFAKPFPPDEILQTIRQNLDHRPTASDNPTPSAP